MKKKAVEHPYTAAYHQWRKENVVLYKKMSNLLDEFYKDKHVDEDVRLRLSGSNESNFELSSENNETLLRFIDGDLTGEEKQTIINEPPTSLRSGYQH